MLSLWRSTTSGGEAVVEVPLAMDRRIQQLWSASRNLAEGFGAGVAKVLVALT